ncbi:hypothetical protein CA13_35460 [Planctomycetes bacterium CA13]|uniref:Leucine Rich repeats (2 copies) n=1 Tax=Novipirellula herctigrandis TaxID=2527986 RepID=A0A5C5Z4V2_9BACT|nr:hypothetical protein CA13_35460 [Planctomycetes bacterium CA13]
MEAQSPQSELPRNPIDLDSESQPETPDLETLDSAVKEYNSLPGQRRRRFVLVVLLAICFFGALAWTHNSLIETEIVEKVELLPSVKLKQQLLRVKREKSKQLHIDSFVVSDEMLQQIADHPDLETVILDQGRITNEGLAVLQSLPKLQHLRLRLSPIGDDGMVTLSGCKSLWFLNLPHSVCTTKGVAALKAIPELRQLRLGSSNLGNEVTREIAELKTLRGVHLIDIAISDEGLKTLTTLPYLESLYLDNSAVTESGWRWLYTQHPELHVHVNQLHHDYDPKYHKHR